MSDFNLFLACMVCWVNGIVLGYILWAPYTPFKRGVLDGLTLKFIWGRFVK